MAEYYSLAWIYRDLIICQLTGACVVTSFDYEDYSCCEHLCSGQRWSYISFAEFQLLTSLLTVNIVSLHFYPFLWAYSGALWLLNIFSCVLAICISFVVICLSIYLAYVFNWIICLTKLCIFNMFNIFWIQLLSQIYILQIFSFESGFLFLILAPSLEEQEFYIIMRSN